MNNERRNDHCLVLLLRDDFHGAKELILGSHRRLSSFLGFWLIAGAVPALLCPDGFAEG